MVPEASIIRLSSRNRMKRSGERWHRESAVRNREPVRIRHIMELFYAKRLGFRHMRAPEFRLSDPLMNSFSQGLMRRSSSSRMVMPS
jgi:hypothetical protein